MDDLHIETCDNAEVWHGDTLVTTGRLTLQTCSEMAEPQSAQRHHLPVYRAHFSGHVPAGGLDVVLVNACGRTIMCDIRGDGCLSITGITAALRRER